MSLVSEAANQLDEIKPGWHNIINVETLDMGSGTFCILGQLFGYDLFAPPAILDRYDPFSDNQPYHYETPKESWIVEINRRKLMQPSSNVQLHYLRKAERLTKQAELHKLRAQEHLKKAKAETALANLLLRAAKLACGT